MPINSAFLFLLIGMAACATAPVQEPVVLCQGKRPTKQLVATIRTYQGVPDGTLIEDMTDAQNFLNQYSKRTAEEFFSGLASTGDIKPPIMFPAGKVNMRVNIIKTSKDLDYAICRDGQCAGIEENNEVNRDAQAFKRFFEDHYFEGVNMDELLKPAQITKKVEGKWSVQRITYNLKGACSNARDKRDLYVGN